jgi:hypothetical protein
MGLKVTKMEAGTCKQTLNFVPNGPNVCLIPAPPPPTGPQGIPTPFPITTTTAKINSGPVPKLKHKNGKVPNTDSDFKGIKGNEAGVGQLPPSMPKKDIITSVNRKNGFVLVGCPNCKAGGSSFVWTGSNGMGNSS